MTLTNNALNLLKAGILSFVLISGTAQAMLPQQERFNQWLDVLEKPLASGTNLSETSAKLLAAPLSRIAAFNLQGLGKIYSDQDKKQGRFDKMAEQLKSLKMPSGLSTSGQMLEMLKKSSGYESSPAALKNWQMDKEW
ncbi:MAG: hypothetical protein IPK04_08810 [Bdellovibrionales bacterium]|nr:hypothetical protein [Bdellovibrionales bacterium]